MSYKSETYTQPPPAAETDAAVIFEHAARLAGAIVAPEGTLGDPVILTPRGYTLQRPEGWEPRLPRRVKAVVQADDCDSFSRYVSEFKVPSTRIFLATSHPEVVALAVIDYHHTTGGADWCAHQVVLKATPSPIWKDLLKANGERMDQGQFAQWIEGHLDAIIEPSGADLLSIVNAFEVDAQVSFSKVQRLQDGAVKMAYRNESTARSGELAIPYRIRVSAPVWVGEPRVYVSARLRFRLSAAGALSLWLELEDIDNVTRGAVQLLAQRIQTGTGIAPFLGRLH